MASGEGSSIRTQPTYCLHPFLRPGLATAAELGRRVLANCLPGLELESAGAAEAGRRVLPLEEAGVRAELLTALAVGLPGVGGASSLQSSRGSERELNIPTLAEHGREKEGEPGEPGEPGRRKEEPGRDRLLEWGGS